jgi:PEP-CTERM motif-containing protein
MRMRQIVIALCSVTLVLAATPAAATPAYSIEGVIIDGTEIAGTVGWTFEPTTDITLVSLGAYKRASTVSTYAEGIAIGFWDSSGVQLAGANAPASIVAGTYGFTAVAPVLLEAGNTYTIGITTLEEFDPVEGTFSGFGIIETPLADVTFDPAINYLGSVFDNAFSSLQLLAWPTTPLLSTNNLMSQVNFEFVVGSVAVPEPSSLLMLGSIAVVWLAVRRRRCCTWRRTR